MKPILPNISADCLARNRDTLRSLPHPKTLRMEIAEAKPRAKRPASRPKIDATAFFVASGLPAPVREYRFAEDRKWRADYAWPEKRVILEVEGAVWTNGRHTRGSGFVKDMEKYNRMSLDGWRLIRCQPHEVTYRTTVGMLCRLLGVAPLPERVWADHLGGGNDEA